ncbi:hypothetical protein [Clostridium sp. C8]|uniref:hypothetical protein n=1 Tax=Clostridium sp. C8 TaxID=1667357 RepID=UPI00062E6FB4|nr:hypothetical protein [Clostridium sp. C8]KLE14229.1 hypothetical protein AAT22_17980 [Clostridium sp. C8]
MLVKVMSIFNCNSDQLFNEIKKSKSLFYIAEPLVKFVEVENHLIPEFWEEGKYLIKMYILGFIPFGSQWIIISMDDDIKNIRDNGYSKIIKKWDHNVYLKDIGNNRTLYADTIEINAGILTLFIVLFANIFYRFRQKRWKKLINNKFDYEA